MCSKAPSEPLQLHRGGADSVGSGVWFPEGHPLSEIHDRRGSGVVGNGPHNSHHRRHEGLIQGMRDDLGGNQLKDTKSAN